ncbi:M55 family metallopeptidase [Thermohalobacter berrensis]|uniref:Amino acid amidase n=1 Tax=Thermohalobacter berrensis TaxID=99594 RepID=A0A419SWC7_9FIRM|nr:M55 family metallopeptidase [Thermohalobacter berrensis]RKD29528.1 amino acid amidase [Thermohalobacter berrensis]
MKVYISADIEGVTGVTSWSEASKSKADYGEFAEQMTKEVKAACEGAIEAGAKEIWIKDAHESGRNISHSQLPENTKLIRGWSEHPFLMVQELDNSFDAAIFIGYHTYSGSAGNPLSHTMNASNLNYIKINDRYASEFLLHAYAASMVGVPVVFISGDKAICKEAKEINSNIKTVAVKEGKGNSTINISPNLSIKLIKEEVKKALEDKSQFSKIKLPKDFKVEISYKNHTKAFKASYYPGMKQISDTNIVYNSDSFDDVLRMLLFVI